MVEPMVCVPVAKLTILAAMAAAEPEDDPPGVWSSLRGLRVPLVGNVANSVVMVLPSITPPDWRKVAIQAASCTG